MPRARPLLGFWPCSCDAAGGGRRNGRGMSADVDLDHMTIRFGGFTAVESVSLRINGGEFFSILGPSGCGKTTLLRTISGFLEPTEGAVRIGGQDMSGIGSNKRPTALIFQNLALFPLMSVAENIGYGLRVRGVGKKERRRKADELLALVALPGQGDKKISELPGGQKQRVAVARARSRSNRRCCCSTSRFRRSISDCASTCAPNCARSRNVSASLSSTSRTIRARR